MGVFEVVTEVESAITANFRMQIDVVAAAKTKALDNTFTFYRRERIESFHKKTLPGIGLWVRDASTTGAKRVERRDWSVTAVIDYFARGTDRQLVGEQIELALDAMMRVIDGLATTGTILQAGEGEFQTVMVHDIADLLQEAAVSPGGPFVSGFRIDLPVRQRDEL